MSDTKKKKPKRTSTGYEKITRVYDKMLQERIARDPAYAVFKKDRTR